MKKILCIVAAMMVMCFAGQAMAALSGTGTLSDVSLTLSLYGGEASLTDTNGQAVLVGLGEVDTDSAWTYTTNVTLSDLGVDTWEEVSSSLVGTYKEWIPEGSRVGTTFYNELFTSYKSDVDVYDGNQTGFKSAYTYTETDLDEIIISEKADSAYLNYYGVTGSYAGFLHETGNEAVLSSTDSTLLTLYSYSDNTSELTIVGYLELYLDGDYLAVSYSPVPVPGAFILLGSALMGIVGIRRKNS